MQSNRSRFYAHCRLDNNPVIGSVPPSDPEVPLEKFNVDRSVVLRMIADNAVKKHDIDYGFMIACKDGYLPMAKLLHSKNADRFMNDGEPFKWACGNGHEQTAKWLHSLGCIPSAHGNDAFQLACENGHLSIAEWLYDKVQGIDIHVSAYSVVVNIPGGRPKKIERYPDAAFTLACSNGELDVAKWLYSLDTFNEDAKYRAYILAYLGNRRTIMDWLVAHCNVNPDRLTSDGLTTGNQEVNSIDHTCLKVTENDDGTVCLHHLITDARLARSDGDELEFVDNNSSYPSSSEKWTFPDMVNSTTTAGRVYNAYTSAHFYLDVPRNELRYSAARRFVHFSDPGRDYSQLVVEFAYRNIDGVNTEVIRFRQSYLPPGRTTDNYIDFSYADNQSLC